MAGGLAPRGGPARRSSWYFVARAAARLVRLLRSDDDDRLVPEGGHAVDDALRPRCGLAADDADRLQLVDLLRKRKQRRHGAERLATEIEVQSGADHATAAGHQLAHHADDRMVEELHLVDADDRRFGRDELQDLLADEHRTCLERIAVVRAHGLHREAIVDGGLEDLHGTARDDRAFDAADELLALSAEHRADDHLEPGVGRGAPAQSSAPPRDALKAGGLARRVRSLRSLTGAPPPEPLLARPSSWSRPAAPPAWSRTAC